MLEKKPIESAGAKPKRSKAAGASAATKTRATSTAARKPGASARHEADLQQRIQQRAYQLWESEGRPEGRDQAHWQQALRELTAQSAR
jgi:Protein of unknown function (DUF2934)